MTIWAADLGEPSDLSIVARDPSENHGHVHLRVKRFTLRGQLSSGPGGSDAAKVLGLRASSNFTLAIIILGNVAVNVLLLLLLDVDRHLSIDALAVCYFR